MAAIRTAVGIAVFRLADGAEVKEHWHRIFVSGIVELAKLGNVLAQRLIEAECQKSHGSRGELVEIWGSLHLAPGNESNFTLYLPQDVSCRASHLPDDFFIPS